MRIALCAGDAGLGVAGEPIHPKKEDTMAIMRWTPARDLLSFEDELNRLFQGALGPGFARPLLPAGWIPAVDLHESEHEYTVQVDLPGVNPKDVKLQMRNDVLTIRGERPATREAGGNVTTHRVERVTGAFERSFTLPARVDANQIKATYKDGVLEIRVPKAPEARTKEIAIDLG